MISLSKLKAIRILSCAILWDHTSAIFLSRVFSVQIRDLGGIHVDGIFFVVVRFGVVFCLVLFWVVWSLFGGFFWFGFWCLLAAG